MILAACTRARALRAARSTDDRARLNARYAAEDRVEAGVLLALAALLILLLAPTVA